MAGGDGQHGNRWPPLKNPCVAPAVLMLIAVRCSWRSVMLETYRFVSSDALVSMEAHVCIQDYW